MDSKIKFGNLLLKIGKISFTTSVVLCPILMLYSMGVATLTLFDLFSMLSILLICLGELLTKNFKNVFKNIYVAIIPFGGYVVLSFIYSSLIFTTFDVDVLMRTLRYLYYIFIIILFSKYFVKDIALQIFKWTCIISTIYIFIQYACLTFFGFYLTGFIPFLPLVDPSIIEVIASINRPHSFFQEPAHYASYIALYVFINLFYTKKGKYNLVLIIFLVIGAIMSAATSGIAMILASLIIYFAKAIKDKNKKEIIMLGTSFGVGLVAIIVLFFLGKLDTVFYKLINMNSFLARIDGYRYIYDFTSFGTGLISIVFGRGMVKSAIYFSGYPRIMFYFGTIGLALFSYSLVCKRKALPLAIFFMILNIGTEAALGTSLVLFFCFFIAFQKEEKEVVPFVEPSMKVVNI